MSDVEAPELLDGLMVQPWQPFKCDVIDYIEQDMDDEFSQLLDMEQEDDTRFQIKCELMDSCVEILMTDLRTRGIGDPIHSAHIKRSNAQQFESSNHRYVFRIQYPRNIG
eukprot:55064_1